MAEMKLHDDVFPFKCDNPDCEEEYNLELFTEVVLLWGYVYLFSEKSGHAIVGLTCPKCKKTTLRKYRAYIAMQCFQQVRFQCKKRWESGSCIQEPILNKAVYFSPEILVDHELIPAESIRLKESSDAIHFSMPEEVDFEVDSFSEVKQKKNSFKVDEKGILALVDIENKYKCKAIPRAVPSTSIYLILDKLLIDEDEKSINMILQVHLIRPNSQRDIDHISKFNDKPTKTNDLLPEDFNCFEATTLSWKREAFKKHLADFIDRVPLVRNKIDCELIFRNQLINKFSRLFYYKTKTIEEQKLDNELNREFEEKEVWEIAGYEKDELFPPEPIRTLNGADLMERWDMDAHGIIHLIENHELTAQDSNHSVSINKNSFNPAFKTELTNGDLEQQKIAMQRFRFDPVYIEEYEQRYPELFKATIKKEFEADPQTSSKNTPKEMVKECCRETARQFLAKDPKMTIAAILRTTNEFEECFKGKEEYKVGERRLRNWLEGLDYDAKGYRRKGT